MFSQLFCTCFCLLEVDSFTLYGIFYVIGGKKKTDFSMEYEEEENSVPGNIPEYGAVFMSNAETKRECFKRRVFALPSSMAVFVKQIKVGMVLFLFEFEKRQLYGVYKATSDGALNILPNAFRSGGKQFPSQVCFTPIWLCSPLSENEFRSAIHENYYSPRKFKFGLSEVQVRRLLELFSTRKLNERSPVPVRQHTRTLGQFSSKGRNQIDHGRFSIIEGIDMEQSKEDFTRNIMNEYLENIEDRSTKIEDIRFYRDDRRKDEEYFKSSGPRFLTDHADDSLHKKRKISYGGLETNEARASPLPFGTDSREASMHKERMPAASGKYLGTEDRDDGWNTSNSPAFGIRYPQPELPFNLPNTTDERHYPNGTNRIPTDDCRFLFHNITTTESGLHNSRRPVISNEHEPCLFDRPGKLADDCEFPRNSKVGHNHHMEESIAPVFPSESFGTPLHRVRGPAGHRLPFTNERLISEHDPDRGQVISSSLSRKVVIPLDSHERKFDEQRYPRNNLVKANWMEGHEGSATLNMPSGYETRLERKKANDFVHHIGTPPRPTKSSGFHQPCQNSLECFAKPSPDGQFPGFTTESQNFKASSSIFQDSVDIRSSLSDVPSARHVRNISFAAHRGTRVAKESLPHHSEVNILGMSKGKSFEAEASNTYKASCFGNKVSFRDYNYSGYPTDEIYDDMDSKSPSSSYYKNYQFPPANLCPFPPNESGYFDNRDNTLAFDDNHEAAHGMQKQTPRPTNDVRKYICRHEDDEIYAGNEHMSPYANLLEFDMSYSEKDPLHRHLDLSRGYRTSVIDDNSEYYGSPEGPCSGHGKHRMSVFARLTSAPMPHRKKQEDDAYFYDAPSVDEVMEMLHQNQNVRIKNLRKFNSVVRQHDEEKEKEKNNSKTSCENQLEHGHPKIISMEIETETNPEIHQVVDDKPKETRIVEFKRRREVKKSLDDKTLENTFRKEDGVSEENEKQKGSLGKQEKRRKLVRPIFGRQNC